MWVVCRVSYSGECPGNPPRISPFCAVQYNYNTLHYMYAGCVQGVIQRGVPRDFPRISTLQKQTVSKCQNYSHFRTFTVSWRDIPRTQKPTRSCCLTISFLLKFHHRKHSYNPVSLTILSQVIAGQFISTHSKFALPSNVLRKTIVF